MKESAQQKAWNKSKTVKLELMDWKTVERTAEEAIRSAIISAELNELMRQKAKVEIIKLGGRISEEDNDTVSSTNTTTKV